MAIKSIIGEKSLAFGKRIAKCYRYLRYSKREHILSDQLLRSGTSIGANVREGLYAQSRKDLLSKPQKPMTKIVNFYLLPLNFYLLSLIFYL